MDKFDIKDIGKLDNQRRRTVLPPDETLKQMKVDMGEIFADIGCGIGYFSLPAAKLVGEQGLVYALDISSEMLKIVDEKINQEGLTNIHTIKNEESRLPLSDGTVTLAFTCNVLHEVLDHRQFLSEAKRILQQDGRLIIIEWEKTTSDYGPPVEHRLDKEEVKRSLEELDFKNISSENLNGYFYIITAQR